MVATNSSISHATRPIMHVARHIAFWMATAVVLGIGTPLRAQSYLTSTGTPSFAAPYPAEMGLVDAASGNLHLEIPLGSYPQRGGGTANMKVIYDSHIWAIYNDGTTSVWTTMQGGWRIVGPSFWSEGIYPDQLDCTFDDTVTEPNGTQHWFHVDLGGTGTRASGCSFSSATAYAIDSSGIQEQWTYADGNWGVNVYAPDGTLVSQGTIDANSMVPEDSNGNYWSYNSDLDPIDTLGRSFEPDFEFYCVDGSCNPDPITFSVPNSQYGTSTGTSAYAFSYAALPVSTNFQLSGVSDCNDACTVTAVTSIGLPDGSSYSFTYDCYEAGNAACNSPEGQSGYYGTLTSMTLPTGATITYGYSTFGGVSWGNRNNEYPSRWLTSKTSSAGAWTYNPVVTAGAGTNNACLPNYYVGCMNVQVNRPDGSFEITSLIVDPIGGSWPQTIQSKDNSGTLLSTVNNTWDFSNSCTLYACLGADPDELARYVGYQDVRKLSTSTTIPVPSGNITKQTTYTYDTPQTANLTQIKEWKYQNGTSPTFPSVPDRGTYMTYATIGTKNNINRPTSITVCNNVGTNASCTGGGTPVAQTNITYDNYGNNGLLGLQDRSTVVNHDDTNFGPSFTARGNPTQISRWVSGSTYLNWYLSYDVTGQVLQSEDPKSNITTYSYADVYYSDNGGNPPQAYTTANPTNAYVTSVTDAIGVTSTGYYYGSGQLALATDYNAQTTYSHYLDPFDRPTETVYPIGWSLNTYTSPTQADSYAAVGDMTPSTSCVSCTHTQALADTLGRVITQSLVNNPAGQSYVNTTYDELNRVSTASHPNFGSTDPNDVYETAHYDGLSRSLGVTHPDNESTLALYGSNVATVWGAPTSQQGSSATYGLGFPVMSVDEAGRPRQEWLDGFGKVIEVDEPILGPTPGDGSSSVSGSERTGQFCYYEGCYEMWDCGTVSVTVNGHTTSAEYGLDQNGEMACDQSYSDPSYDTAGTVAARLVAAINADTGAYVTAELSNGTSILLTSKTGGTSTDYSLSVTSVTAGPPSVFPAGSTSFPISSSGSTLVNGSNNGPVLTTPLVTNYLYDALGNLTSVVQGSQTRSYQYDGLSRLTQDTTPEAGTVTLAYVTTSGTLCSGNPSNPCTRTAPHTNQASGTVTTTYTYDTANRLTTKTHSDTTGTETYTYGTSASSYNIGRLKEMTDPSGSEIYFYDKIGRITEVNKTIAGITYDTDYTYNVGSELTKITYPSGRVVEYSYDHVGHLCEVAVSAGANCGSTTGLYLTLPSLNYDAASRPLTATYGNGVVATAAYSPQTAELTSLSYANGSTTLFGLNYYYQQNSTNCPTGNVVGNNGQIQCIADVSSGTGDSGRSVAYTFDALGRLLTANTTGSTQYPAWGLSWTYDRYGNRTNQTVTAGSGYTSLLTINPVNNQITSPAYTYDGAGNVTAEPAPGAATYTYNAEECNTGYTGNGTATYTCDGNGLHVEKVVTGGTNAVTTVYVRSGGQVIAEYDGTTIQKTSPTREYIYGNNLLAIVTGSSGGTGGTITYQHRDTLSPRIYTDVNGNCVGDQGTFPYGELWYQNTDTECGTSATSSWIFTSYERDAESGNDYALARSYTNSNGRFLSPDPLQGHVGDPQSWNRYAYVENDPINLSDPSGQGFWADLGLAIASVFVDVLCQACIPAMTAVDEGAATAQGVDELGRLLVAIGVIDGWVVRCGIGNCTGMTFPSGSTGAGNTGPGSAGGPSTGDPASNTGSSPAGTAPVGGGGQGGGTTDVGQTGAAGQGPGTGGGNGAPGTASPAAGNPWHEVTAAQVTAAMVALHAATGKYNVRVVNLLNGFGTNWRLSGANLRSGIASADLPKSWRAGLAVESGALNNINSISRTGNNVVISNANPTSVDLGKYHLAQTISFTLAGQSLQNITGVAEGRFKQKPITSWP
jgi:RHS repeat-associated protein